MTRRGRIDKKGRIDKRGGIRPPRKLLGFSDFYMIVEDHDSSKALFVTVSVLLVFDCSKFKHRGQKWFQNHLFFFLS